MVVVGKTVRCVIICVLFSTGLAFLLPASRSFIPNNGGPQWTRTDMSIQNGRFRTTTKAERTGLFMLPVSLENIFSSLETGRQVVSAATTTIGGPSSLITTITKGVVDVNNDLPAATAFLIAAFNEISSTTNNSNNGDAVAALSPETTIAVFIAGLIPFVIATIEFWRRIAVGASFGTGKDSVLFPTTIGEDDNPLSIRGRRVLGQDALIVAVLLFAIAAATLALVAVSVLTSPLPPSPYSLPVMVDQ